MQTLGMTDVGINPVPNLSRPVSLEAHPHFETAEATRLLEAVDVVLVTLVGAVHLVGQIRWLHAERESQATFIFHEDRTRIQRRVEPFVRVHRDRIRQFEPLPFLCSLAEHKNSAMKLLDFRSSK